jgi:hypothetical protein
VDAQALVAHLRTAYRVLPRTVGPSTVRVSTALFNNEEELDRLIVGMQTYLNRH